MAQMLARASKNNLCCGGLLAAWLDGGGRPQILGEIRGIEGFDIHLNERNATLGPIRFFVFEVGFLLLFWFGILRARERLQVPPKPRGYGGAKPPFQSRQARFVNLSPNWIANCRTAAFQVTGGFFHFLVMFRKAR